MKVAIEMQAAALLHVLVLVFKVYVCEGTWRTFFSLMALD